MKKYNILFCDNSAAMLSNAMTFFANDPDISLLTCNTPGIFPDLMSLGIDSIVMDAELTWGKESLQSLGERRPKTLLTCPAQSDEAISSLPPSTFYDYVFYKPYSLAELRVKILNMLMSNGNNFTHVKVNSSKNMDERLSSIFIRAGIPPHIKGYQFLREAVKLAVAEPEIINSITKKLYPSVAANYNTTASKVERAIRHAIEVAWNRGKIENINAIFGIKIYNKGEKPTNGELIALVADKIMIENM